MDKTEHDPKTYTSKGYIDLEDNVAFKRIVDACYCFGLNHKGYRKAMARHPVEKDKVLWFPKLYEGKSWQTDISWKNDISDDGKIITEKCKKNNPEFVKASLSRPENFKRIVFAAVKDPSGPILYCFKGLFEINEEKSRDAQAIIYERTGTRVKTYSARQ